MSLILFYPVECPRGFYNTDGNTCKLCPKGKYTDRPGQSSCLPCDAGTTTYNEGSVLKSQCLGMCTAVMLEGVFIKMCLPSSVVQWFQYRFQPRGSFQ